MNAPERIILALVVLMFAVGLALVLAHSLSFITALILFAVLPHK